MKKISFIFFIVFLNYGCGTSFHKTNETDENPYVLLISIDGYRHDYTDQHAPPHLTKFRNSGLSAEYLAPVFPSKTFPNHLSIATGLYPEEHGIIGNSFYSPSRNKYFSVTDPSEIHDGSWYGGTPLWVMAEKNGIKSACYFWPGCEAEIQGTRPSYYKKWDAKVSSLERVEQVVDWLKLPLQKRPHFIALYFSIIDETGHDFGPESKEIHEQIIKLDEALGELFSQLSLLRLPLTTIILSDHGMQEIEQKNIVRVDQLVDIEEYKKSKKVFTSGASMMFYESDPQKKMTLFKKLKKNARHFDVYLKENIPDAWHFKNNERIGDILLVSTFPYLIIEKDRKIEKGQHGFAPWLVPSMRGVFYVQGPGIKSEIIPALKNIRVYDFVLKKLGFTTQG